MYDKHKSSGLYNERVFEVSESDLPPPPKEVLLVEDDPIMVEILKEFLESHSFRVTTAKSGVEGLKSISHSTFDAILCDMVMPGLAGDLFYMAVQRIKPELCKRFIFITGHKGNPKIDSFIRSIRGLILWKPFQMADMLTAINGVLKPEPKGR